MHLDDAAFIIELLNTPGWLQYIGDRGIHTIPQAQAYLSEKVIPSYERFGFGFYIIETKPDGIPVGNCGLIRRLGLDHVDIGYSLLTKYESQGYAFEATRALLQHGFKNLGLDPIQAISTFDNERSKHLLEKLGMTFQHAVNLPDDDDELMLYSISAPEEGI